MNDYFPREQGIGYRMGTDVRAVIRTIAHRYVSDNPPVPVTYYLRSSENFHISEDYMDEVKLHEKFPGWSLKALLMRGRPLPRPRQGNFTSGLAHSDRLRSM